MIRHAGLIARRMGGVWRGVLIEGPAGAGKSDLMLRALDQGFRLVADDRVALWTCEGRLYGRAPETLAGLLEVRGLEVVETLALPLAQVGLVAACADEVERIPPPQRAERLGISLPLIALDPRPSSAPAKLSRALTLFDAAHKRGI